MTLDFETKSGEIRTFTTKSRQHAFGLKPVKTGDRTPCFCSPTATDPEFISDDTASLNAYSRGFFVCWLLGLLVTTVAHFIHFSG